MWTPGTFQLPEISLVCNMTHKNSVIIIIIIIILIIIVIISFTQGIYTYIPATNYVPREYSVATILFYYSWCLHR